MNATIEDLRSTIIPKSDQLNADQLIGCTMDLTITDVHIGVDEKQPVVVHYENENGRPFKPCLTMRRVLIAAWGIDGTQWIGKSLRVYHDQRVRFGGAEVGGVRISHMTDIPGQRIELRLSESKGKRVMHTIERMESPARGPSLDEVLAAIKAANNSATMKAARTLAESLKSADDMAQAVAAYKARAAELKSAASAEKVE